MRKSMLISLAIIVLVTIICCKKTEPNTRFDGTYVGSLLAVPEASIVPLADSTYPDTLSIVNNSPNGITICQIGSNNTPDKDCDSSATVNGNNITFPTKYEGIGSAMSGTGTLKGDTLTFTYTFQGEIYRSMQFTGTKQ